MESALLALLIFIGILAGMGWCCLVWKQSKMAMNEEYKEEVHTNFLTFGTTDQEDYSRV